MTEAIVHIFDKAVIIQVEDLASIHPHPEITRHATTPGEISPLRESPSDAVVFTIPTESVRAGGCFLAGRRGIEADFDGLVEEMERGEVYSSSSSFSNLSISTS